METKRVKEVTFLRTVRVYSKTLCVSIPKTVQRLLGLEKGDVVRVTIRFVTKGEKIGR